MGKQEGSIQSEGDRMKEVSSDRTGEAIRRQADLLQKTFDSITDAVFILDAKVPPTILECNKAASAIFGYDKAEMLGRLTDFLHVSEETLKEFQSQLYPAVQQGPFHLPEFRMKRKNGSIFPTEHSVSQLLNDKGERTGWVSIVRDITERKRVEEALANDRNLLRTLIDNLPDNIFIKDAESRFVISNLAHAHLLRAKTPDEIIGKTDFDIFPPELAASYYADEQAVIRSGQPLLNREERTIDPEGKMQWLLTTKVPLRDDQGKVIGLVGINRNNTERKRMEDELQRYSKQLEEMVFERTKKLSESESRFRELSDLLPQIVFEIDENGNVQFMNRAAFAATGLGEEDFRRGLNAFQMFVPEDHDRARQRMRRLLGGEKLAGDEYTVHRTDGSTFPAIVYAAPVMHGNRAVGLRGIVIDITERKRAEEELRAARERLERVIVSNPAVIFTGKPRADFSDYNATYMSKRAAEVTGFGPEEFINHPEIWDRHVHLDDYGRLHAAILRLWETGCLDIEYRFLRKDGRERWLREEALLVRDAAGKPLEVIGCWTDISERKQMEEALLRSQRLATIGEVAAMVGHDLRNPLQAISTGVYLGRKGYESLPPEYAKVAEECGLVKWLSLVEDEIQYMDKIVSDLQNYAAPLKPDLSQVNIGQLLKDVLSKTQIPSNINVSIRVEEDLQLMIDSDLMKRVFSNLITNAVQAMPKGGELTVDASKSDEEALVSFHDTGVGIPQEDFSKLFSPFFTTKAKGQGLGLAVCKRLVEAHGGEITIESRLGEGTTFTIRLPHRRL